LLNFPLIELQIRTNYNQTQGQSKSLNHYAYLQAKNLDHYLNLLQDFSTKDFYLELKLNLPSFGTLNTSKQKCRFLPQLMQQYT